MGSVIGCARAVFVISVLSAGLAEAGQTPWREARLTCKSVSSCEQAVILWCGGYRRADGDHDGIPCENVCDTIEEVDAIRAAIGC